MKNKKNIIVTCLLGSVAVFANFTTLYKTAGSHPGSTGAPGESNCTKSGCHATASLWLSDTVVNHLVFPTPDSTYVPGQTYTLTLNVENSGITKFGFELVALKKTDNTNIGQFTITDTLRTQIINHTTNGNVRYSVTHTTVGTATTTPGFTQWTFDWTAPPTNVGLITFYYATNCTNNNGNSSGDAIYLSRFKLKPYSGTTIEEFINNAATKVYYDPSTRSIGVDYYLKADKQVAIQVYDNMGREICRSSFKTRSKGQQKEQVNIPGNISAGVYFVKLLAGNQVISKKIMIQ